MICSKRPREGLYIYYSLEQNLFLSQYLKMTKFTTETRTDDRFPLNPGRDKNAKICKISGEKLVFSPQIS